MQSLFALQTVALYIIQWIDLLQIGKLSNKLDAVHLCPATMTFYPKTLATDVNILFLVEHIRRKIVHVFCISVIVRIPFVHRTEPPSRGAIAVLSLHHLFGFWKVTKSEHQVPASIQIQKIENSMYELKLMHWFCLPNKWLQLRWLEWLSKIMKLVANRKWLKVNTVWISPFRWKNIWVHLKCLEWPVHCPHTQKKKKRKTKNHEIENSLLFTCPCVHYHISPM